MRVVKFGIFRTVLDAFRINVFLLASSTSLPKGSVILEPVCCVDTVIHTATAMATQFRPNFDKINTLDMQVLYPYKVHLDQGSLALCNISVRCGF